MFDFTEAMSRLICHITSTHPDFAHVKFERMLVSYIQTRAPGAHGVYASCQPLRFEGGERTKKHRGRTYMMPEVTTKDGQDVLYILYFALPRFINLTFEQKMTTVFHELYHIGPKFNGDIRRFRGKNYAHGHSRKVFNDKVSAMANDYLALPESSEYVEFLRHSFAELCEQHSGVIGTRVRPPRPKLVKE